LFFRVELDSPITNLLSSNQEENAGRTVSVGHELSSGSFERTLVRLPQMSENWKLNDRIQDRYEIKRIKRGGMGVVFLCYERHKKIAVAIKTFQDRYLLDDHSKRRFLAEADSWLKLGRHPNIVEAYSVESIHYRPYILVECVAGDVHRDIKPANILLAQGRVIKLTDFGLLKTFDDYPEDILSESFVKATRRYKTQFTKSGINLRNPCLSISRTKQRLEGNRCSVRHLLLRMCALRNAYRRSAICLRELPSVCLLSSGSNAECGGFQNSEFRKGTERYRDAMSGKRSSKSIFPFRGAAKRACCTVL